MKYISQRFLACVPFCLAAVVANATQPDSDRSLKIAGVVIDATTSKPLDGAWVLLSFHEARTDGFSASTRCVRTTGMYTGANGAFHFTVDKEERIGAVTAIRPGYHLYAVDQPTREQWNARDSKAFSNFKILLQEQDQNHPRWDTNPEAYCDWARTSKDVEAADTFLEIQVEDEKRYGNSPERTRALQNVINRHKSLGAAVK